LRSGRKYSGFGRRFIGFGRKFIGFGRKYSGYGFKQLPIYLKKQDGGTVLFAFF
jgi:hypothetical protein